MLCRSFACLFLAISFASASMPRSDFEDFAIPDVTADTVFTTRDEIVHYGDNPAMTQQYIQMLVAAGYVHDEAAKTLTITHRGFQTLVRDDHGAIVETHEFTTMLGFPISQGNWEARLDDQGRQVLEIRSEDDKFDTTFFTWTNADCPDREIRNGDSDPMKLAWSVDPSGNCSEGVYSQYSREGRIWMDSVKFLSWQWESGKPVVEVVSTPDGDGLDTSEITQISYTNGVPSMKKRWAKEGFLPLMLAESCAIATEGGLFVSMVCDNFLDDGSGRVSEHRTIAVARPTAVQPSRRSQSYNAPKAWSSRGAYVFLNPGRSARTIELRSFDGSTRTRIRIEAGQRHVVPASTGGVVWRALGAPTAAGILVAPR